MFTVDTESGFSDAVFITSSYGLWEAVVQGAVNPDEFYVLQAGAAGWPARTRGLGGKPTKMVYTTDATVGRTPSSHYVRLLCLNPHRGSTQAVTVPPFALIESEIKGGRETSSASLR